MLENKHGVSPDNLPDSERAVTVDAVAAVETKHSGNGKHGAATGTVATVDAVAAVEAAEAVAQRRKQREISLSVTQNK